MHFVFKFYFFFSNSRISRRRFVWEEHVTLTELLLPLLFLIDVINRIEAVIITVLHTDRVRVPCLRWASWKELTRKASSWSSSGRDNNANEAMKMKLALSQQLPSKHSLFEVPKRRAEKNVVLLLLLLLFVLILLPVTTFSLARCSCSNNHERI